MTCVTFPKNITTIWEGSLYVPNSETRFAQVMKLPFWKLSLAWSLGKQHYNDDPPPTETGRQLERRGKTRP